MFLASANGFKLNINIILGLAKDEGFFKEGLTYLEYLKHMTNLSEDTSVRIQLMDAQLSWLVNNNLIARHILNKLCKNRAANPK